ncbi:MAG TPA: hypothetical protein GXX35_14475 [Thermoanaerobacterales bacterium]|nr:hypothetical protein [Thermoanaerobacterales bacterium]
MKKVLLKIWFIWEWIFEKLTSIHPVPGGFFRIAIRTYRGAKLICMDGTALNPGDRYGELHLNNRFFTELSKQCSSPAFLGISSLRESKKAFALLKEYVKSEPLFKDVNVFMGYTLLNRGIKRLGFEVRDIKSGFVKNLFSNYEKMLLAILHPEGFKRIMSKKMVSKQVLITKNTLEKLY